MVKTKVVNQIEFNGSIFENGHRVRVLLKNSSEYIGTIAEILPESFSIRVDDEVKTFPVDTVQKIRTARANENFYNTWSFDDTGKEKYCVVATRKSDRSESMNVLVSVTAEQAQRYCEQWGWSYSEGEKNYWLSIEPMN